jgi:hypothetical protein
MFSISGFHRDVDAICDLLGYYAESCGNNFVNNYRGPLFTELWGTSNRQSTLLRGTLPPFAFMSS